MKLNTGVDTHKESQGLPPIVICPPVLIHPFWTIRLDHPLRLIWISMTIEQLSLHSVYIFNMYPGGYMSKPAENQLVLDGFTKFKFTVNIYNVLFLFRRIFIVLVHM